MHRQLLALEGVSFWILVLYSLNIRILPLIPPSDCPLSVLSNPA